MEIEIKKDYCQEKTKKVKQCMTQIRGIEKQKNRNMKFLCAVGCTLLVMGAAGMLLKNNELQAQEPVKEIQLQKQWANIRTMADAQKRIKAINHEVVEKDSEEYLKAEIEENNMENMGLQMVIRNIKRINREQKCKILPGKPVQEPKGFMIFVPTNFWKEDCNVSSKEVMSIMNKVLERNALGTIADYLGIPFEDIKKIREELEPCKGMDTYANDREFQRYTMSLSVWLRQYNDNDISKISPPKENIKEINGVKFWLEGENYKKLAVQIPIDYKYPVK